MCVDSVPGSSGYRGRPRIDSVVRPARDRPSGQGDLRLARGACSSEALWLVHVSTPRRCAGSTPRLDGSDIVEESRCESLPTGPCGTLRFPGSTNLWPRIPRRQGSETETLNSCRQGHRSRRMPFNRLALGSRWHPSRARMNHRHGMPASRAVHSEPALASRNEDTEAAARSSRSQGGSGRALPPSV